MKYIKLRLSILNFLEFAIWGCYLTSLGNFLWQSGLEKQIFWFYAVQGLVSLFMPTVMGYVADRIMESRKVISCCQIISATFKIGALIYCLLTPQIEFFPLFLLFSLGIAFYIPTIGLNNALVLGIIKSTGADPVKVFPKVRVFGTIGFIVAMLMVNFIPFRGMPLQSTVWQLGLSALFGLITCVFVLTFKIDKTVERNPNPERKHYSYLSLIRESRIAIFLSFVFLISICLQITNSYSNVFISSFSQINEFKDSWGAENANAIISLSQISEALCVLLVPFFYKIFDIKRILIIASIAWALRFGFLGIGNPNGGMVFLILSMIVYGIAFDFVNIAGAIYLDSLVEHSLKNRIQGLFMMVMSGLGALIGTPLAGMVVNQTVYSKVSAEAQLIGWHESWFIFAAYAFIIAILLYIIYPSRQKSSAKL